MLDMLLGLIQIRAYALYDKRTLNIPPDALKKMTASQKQYWNVKSQYMGHCAFLQSGKLKSRHISFVLFLLLSV